MDDDLKSQGNYRFATDDTIIKEPLVERRICWSRARFCVPTLTGGETLPGLVLKRPFRLSFPMTDGITAAEPRAPESL